MVGSVSPARRLGLWLLAALVLLPLLRLFATWSQLDEQIWVHLWQTQMMRLLTHSLILLLGVGVGVLILGVSNAWLVARCDYPGRRWLEKLLFLPLALPAYVFAFVFLGLLDYAGPIRSGLRTLLGGDPDWLDPRSAVAVCAILSLAFYPYVYLLARAAFLRQGIGPYETARLLGRNRFQAFWHAALPLARPAVAAGLLLALMETLADFGAVSVLGFDTFTTAIYKTWFGMFSLRSAAQLATLLLLAMLLLAVFERRQRGRAVYHATHQRHYRIQLTGLNACLAWVWQGSLVALAVVIPVGQLAWWGWNSDTDWSLLGQLALNTILLGTIGAAVVIVVSGVLVGLQRRESSWAAELATAGYALPGTVLAVAVSLTLISIGQLLGQPVLLTTSLLALLVAYVIRFLRVGYGPIHSAYLQTKPSLIEAAQLLGADSGRRLRKVWLPMLEPGIVTAALLVAVEIMKEMPATLMLRPFGWDTLAVRIYNLTAEGEWQLAALPALLLVLIGLVPVWSVMRARN